MKVYTSPDMVFINGRRVRPGTPFATLSPPGKSWVEVDVPPAQAETPPAPPVSIEPPKTTPVNLDDLTDEQLFVLVEKRAGQRPHHATGRAKLLSLARAALTSEADYAAES